MRLVFATRNHGKLVELRALCADLPIEIITLDQAGVDGEVIEDGRTFADNAKKKAESALAATALPALADDSGLEIDALDGAPGVDSAIWAGLPSGAPGADRANNDRMVRALAAVPAPRSARYRCVLALAMPNEATLFEEATIEGQIVLDPRGQSGFGYDPYFLVPALARTLAELSLEEKNRISHRGKAMAQMAARLRIRLAAPFPIEKPPSLA